MLTPETHTGLTSEHTTMTILKFQLEDQYPINDPVLGNPGLRGVGNNHVKAAVHLQLKQFLHAHEERGNELILLL